MSTKRNNEVKAVTPEVTAETSQGEVTQEAQAQEAKAKQEAKTVADGEKYIVIHPFADKDNFGKMWEEGEDVSHFDKSRLDSCIERELVKKA